MTVKHSPAAPGAKAGAWGAVATSLYFVIKLNLKCETDLIQKQKLEWESAPLFEIQHLGKYLE